MTTFTGTLVGVDCCVCGITFGLPETYEEERRADHKGFYCPNGHSLKFEGESESARLKRHLKAERESAARLRAELDQTEASLRATKGAKTKLRRKLDRVEAGVCPHCNRSFENLARHMASKHGCAV